jgi:hypothetical protein
VRTYSLLDWFRVRENSLRAHLLPFGLVSRSRELLAYALTPFWTGFAFARTPCVRTYSLLDWFCVRENSLRAHLLPFGLVSRSRELLACTFTPFCEYFAFARTPCVHVYSLLDWFRVRENSLRTRLPHFVSVSRSRELLACTFTPFCECFAFARTLCVHVLLLLGEVRVRENFLRTRLLPFCQDSCTR